MNEIGLDELKRIELNLLMQFHRVCTDNGMRYSISGGTLIGAVRHGGFIPWDDDIDVLMPRPDYDRFVAYCMKNHTPFRLISNDCESGYGYLFAKICDPSTVIYEENSHYFDGEMGVYLDIFPVEGAGNSLSEAKKIFMKTEFLRELLVAANWERFERSKTHAWYYEPARWIMFCLSRFVSRGNIIKKIEKEFRRVDFDQSSYSGAFCGSYRLRELMPSKVFREIGPMMFEGMEVMAMLDYDTYLSNLFGDYMELPPVEKQVSHHAFQAYYKENAK